MDNTRAFGWEPVVGQNARQKLGFLAGDDRARLDDLNEPVYRIDRMLRQLKLSGLLSSCKAIAFGECVKCPDDAGGGARSLDEVLGELVGELKIPCITGIPVGHIAEQWTIPLGAMATLDADTSTLTVMSYAD